MKRLKLLNYFPKDRNDAPQSAHRKCNLCVTLLQKVYKKITTTMFLELKS